MRRDGRRVPAVAPAVEDCPVVETHTASPSGYIAWLEWAERMNVTHQQTECPSCGAWSIWTLKETT